MTKLTLTQACAHLSHCQDNASISAMAAHQARMGAAHARGKPNEREMRHFANMMVENARGLNAHYEQERQKVAMFFVGQQAANDEPVPFGGDVA